MAPRDDLQSKWNGTGRYNCFGDAITRLTLSGIRCHRQTNIQVASPITAFSGLNGTGKSTLLQMAVIAYKNSHFGNTYYVRNFLVSSSLDPSPFNLTHSSIGYEFCDSVPSGRQLTTSYNLAATRWRGYERRRERPVFFCGIGNYLPRIEKRDFVIRHARNLSVIQTANASQTINDWTCRVLGHQYSGVKSTTVGHGGKSQAVCVLERNNTAYSEAHMGFGEGRAHFLIQALETLPDRSLAVIEEPETSLHQRAQFGLGQYLVDVCNRKRHQVLLTTHSQYLLNALHSKSRFFLYHDSNGVSSLHGLAASQANSLLTEGFDKALTVLVEDECARILLAELMRRIDSAFLSTVAISVGGGSTDLSAAARAMKNAPIRFAVVKDGDMGATPTDFVFKLPGNKPPEKELLEDVQVQNAIDTHYGGSVANVLVANTGVDHHQWFDRIATSVSAPVEAVVEVAARAYATGGLLANEVSSLISQLKDAATQ